MATLVLINGVDHDGEDMSNDVLSMLLKRLGCLTCKLEDLQIIKLFGGFQCLFVHACLWSCFVYTSMYI